MAFKTIIVEDEPLSMLFLKSLLTEYCPEAEVIATAASEDEAVSIISENKPDLVLMDIELQQGNGFGVLRRTWQQRPYHIIYTTALDYDGIRAIRFSGVNYLQKPIDIESLQTVIRSLNTGVGERGNAAVTHLLKTLSNNNLPESLLLNSNEGNQYVLLDDIIYITVRDNRCVFITGDNSIQVSESSLVAYELLLQDLGFFRPSADFILNTAKIAVHSKPETGNVVMINNEVIPISPKRQGQLSRLMFSAV